VIPTVFVGRPSELGHDDERAARDWEDAVSAAGMRPRRLTNREYEDDAWAQLHRVMRGVDGMLVLGFGGSPWLHIEAGIALVLGSPVLVVPGPGTAAEGVFDPAAWTARLSGVPGGARPADGFPRAWVDAVGARCRAREP
jgi:hypothetical protein